MQDASGRGGKAAATKAGKAAVDRALTSEMARMAADPRGQLVAIADLQSARAGRLKTPDLELAGRPDLQPNDVPAKFIDPAKAKPGKMGSLLPEQIKVDAQRFQYKATTEASGEVGSLEGVSRYDTNLGGVLSVWKDPANGQTYVINGHNRLAAAKRLGADAVEVRYIKAADAAEARAIGALANIAEGHGTAVDAAKFMRDSGLSGQDVAGRYGVPMKKEVATQGAALANLPDDIWRMVVDETISPDKGAVIGGSGLDAQGMAKVEKILRHRPNASVKTLQEIVAAEKASMEMGTTGSLFGDDVFDAGYQMERASLTRTMRDRLLSDKALFKAMSSSKAQRELEATGSVVDTDATSARAQSSESLLNLFDQLKNASGPVASALSEGTRRLQQVKNAAERVTVERDVEALLREAMLEELGDVGAQVPMPPESPGQESLF